ncbi:ribonuclease HII [Aurantimonas endophytica]|uniref:Ribonuclease HII n=2 Tax=Aurantimonas endophytica TaxID=1522175 RepID=A0A7W6HD29_9HYPH|nr:ribonuclease HII [Aurantimonas endophytica]MBB4002936.1 ribonuclease HII [Aurantimonas endophytica]
MRESCRNMARRSSDSPAPSKGQAARAVGPDFTREDRLLGSGARCVAGIDEAGRGPLAGPVVAAAVILDPSRLPQGLDDSKKLERAERERLFGEIVASAWVGIASASAREIDVLNIRGATLLAMRRALHALGDPPCHVLIDGRDVPPRLRCPGTAVIGGDALSLSIAAASIVAKVTRDRMMHRACPTYAGYGFSRHVGYATAEHLSAIARLGPTPLHRMSFRPLRPDLLDAAE